MCGIQIGEVLSLSTISVTKYGRLKDAGQISGLIGFKFLIKVDKGRPKVPGKVRVQFCHFWAPSIQKYMAENGKTCFGAPGCQRARPAPQVGRRPRTTLAGVHAAGGRASARTFAALRGGSRIFRHVFCMEGAAKQKWQN